MKTLYLDCFSGISGDMMVGALCDLGVRPSTLEWELSKVEIGDFHMHFERASRCGISGTKFGIHEGATHRPEPEHGHGDCCGHDHGGHHPHDEGHHHDHEGHHDHSHDAQEHAHVHGRNHAEIRALITDSDLSDFVKRHALSIFERIAVAEGKIHGVPSAEVAFHEVGALDSIADILCACIGLEELKIEQVLVSPLRDGRGFAKMSHGSFPIPAPATLEILAGIPLEQIDEPNELITPTGAAIVAEFGKSFSLMPAMRTERIGYGIGTREHPVRPNVLRAIVGEVVEEKGTYAGDIITRIETNIDDMSPELLAPVIDRLLAGGALDVFFTPIQMKKNRLATMLTVLCESANAEGLANEIFRQTTSFGVRMDEVRRRKLERHFEEVATPFGAIRIKVGSLRGEVLQAAPEFDCCQKAAEKTGATIREIDAAAREAYRLGKSRQLEA